MTHGPAISTKGWPAPKALNSIGTRVLRLLAGRGVFGRFGVLNQRRQPLAPIRVCRPDECLEKRVRLHGLTLELGMELASQEPGMIGDFANLDVGIVGRLAGDAEAGGLEAV